MSPRSSAAATIAGSKSFAWLYAAAFLQRVDSSESKAHASSKKRCSPAVASKPCSSANPANAIVSVSLQSLAGRRWPSLRSTPRTVSSKALPIPSTRRASRHSSNPARLLLTTAFAHRLPRVLLCSSSSQGFRIPETLAPSCAPPPHLAPRERPLPLRASAARPAPSRQKHFAPPREPRFIFRFLRGPLLRSCSHNSRWREFAPSLRAYTSLATESSRCSLPGKSIGANPWHCLSATKVPAFPKR